MAKRGELVTGGKAELARAARDKYGLEMPTLKLARILYNENKLVFKDVEEARMRLRYIEGKFGNRNKKHAVRESKYFVSEERARNPYQLPESNAKEIKPAFYTGYKRALIFADVHIPYHDIDAITLCFDYAKKEKPDIIVIDGDLIDCFQLSKFIRNPKERDFKYELDQLKLFFERLKKIFPNTKIVYKLGNHELRYQHFLWQKAQELAGVEEFELENIIKARAEGIDVIDDKRIIMLNELPIIHGHEFGRQQFSPVNTARGLFLRGVHTCMQADSHRGSKHSEPNMFKKTIVTWSIGCLCGLWPDYAVYNKWGHGFAMVDLDANKKNFEVRLKDIYEGRVF